MIVYVDDSSSDETTCLRLITRMLLVTTLAVTPRRMDQGEEEAWGYSHKSWGEVCFHFPKPLRYFDQNLRFMLPYYDLSKNSTVEEGTVALNISYDGLLLTGLLIMIKN